MAVTMLALAAHGRSAQAATFHAHDGASLQTAVASADSSPGSNTIELSAGTFSPASTLTLSGQITIVGPSMPPGAKLDGGAVEPFPSDLIEVEAHAKATLRNLELTTAAGPGSGAAIDDFGALDLESSTLAGNNGPGLLVQPGATASVTNSTLSDGLGFGIVDQGSASLSSSTVTANAGGGIDDASGILDLTNTIVAGDGKPDCTRPARNSDHSLDGDGSCGVGALGHTDPRLGRLLLGGGPTPTRALAGGSPAIAAGDVTRCPSTDQRGFVHPAGRCDIGAYQTDGVPSVEGDAKGAHPGTAVKSNGSGWHHTAGACLLARSHPRRSRSRHSITHRHGRRNHGGARHRRSVRRSTRSRPRRSTQPRCAQPKRRKS